MNSVSKEDVVEETDGVAFARSLAPDEREALEAAGVDPAAVEARERSYRRLLEADVDEEVADDLRRRLSLPWSFETGGDDDLGRRSARVRGLGEAERAWIAASADESWQAFEAARTRATENESEEGVERPWPRPTPVTAVVGVGPENANRLAEAGVNSAERLATIDATAVANALDLDVVHVRTWRHNARQAADDGG